MKRERKGKKGVEMGGWDQEYILFAQRKQYLLPRTVRTIAGSYSNMTVGKTARLPWCQRLC